MFKIKSLVLAAALLPASAIAGPNQNQDQGWQQDQEDEQDQPQTQSPNQNPNQNQTTPGTVEVESYQWTAGRGRLGVMLMGLTPELRGFFGAPNNSGLLVASVAQGSPAARAGLRVGDVITRVSGQPVTSVDDIVAAMAPQGQEQNNYTNYRRVNIEIVRDHRMYNVRAMIEPRHQMQGQQPQQPGMQQQPMQQQPMQQQPMQQPQAPMQQQQY